MTTDMCKTELQRQHVVKRLKHCYLPGSRFSSLTYIDNMRPLRPSTATMKMYPTLSYIADNCLGKWRWSRDQKLTNQLLASHTEITTHLYSTTKTDSYDWHLSSCMHD